MDQFVLKFKSLLMDLQYLKGHYPSVSFKFKLIRTYHKTRSTDRYLESYKSEQFSTAP